MHDDHECFNSRSSAGGQLSSRDVPENVKPDALDGVKEDYRPSAPLRTCHRTRFIIYKATTLLPVFTMFLHAVRIPMSLCWFSSWSKYLFYSHYTHRLMSYSSRDQPKEKYLHVSIQTNQLSKICKVHKSHVTSHVTCKHNGNVKTRDNTSHFKVSWNVNCASQILYVETLRIALRTYIQKWLNTWLFSINQKRKWCIKRYRAYWTSKIAQSTQSYSCH